MSKFMAIESWMMIIALADIPPFFLQQHIHLLPYILTTKTHYQIQWITRAANQAKTFKSEELLSSAEYLAI